MRILLLATDAFGGRGGIARYTRDLATAIASHPRTAEIVLIPRHLPDPAGPLPLKVRFVDYGSRGKLAYVAAVAREASRPGRFDLVLAAHINLLPLARVAAWVSRARLSVLLHGIEAWKRGGPAIRIALRGVDAAISVSRLTAERFHSWAAHPRPVHLLPNAIRATDFHPGSKDASLLDRYGLAGKRVLLTVGRLDPYERSKGFDEVIDVLGSLPAEVMYLIVGEGPDRARLEAAAQSKEVANRVVFAGYVREEEKADHYRLADAYVMPSRGEGFGFVFLEALASGLPVIASKLDGGREAVLDGAMGALVDPANRQELHSAILEALNKPRRVPEELEHYSFENFQRRCHRMVDEILNG